MAHPYSSSRLSPTESRPLSEIARYYGSIILETGTGQADAAVSALSGAIQACRDQGRPDPQFYGIHRDPVALRQAYSVLHRANLTDHCLLYQGDLSGFQRDIPVTPSMVHLLDGQDYLGVWTDLQVLRNFLAPGTPVLCQHYGDTPSIKRAVDEWTASGFFEEKGRFGQATLICATSRCMGRVEGLTPETFARVRTLLMGRYLQLSSAACSAARVPSVRQLTQPARNRWISTRCARGSSGLGPWPHVASDAEPLPPTLPNGHPWPKISVITPSFNQGKYIEETLLSVAHQGYPNVEHIVIDGGSTDQTLAILQAHRHSLAHLVSEKDRGQSHAINKGFARATGDLVTWLNSDDMLAPGALAALALAFHESGADMVAGICQLHTDGIIHAQHLTSCPDGPLPLDDLLDLDHGWNAGQFFYQPEVMFTRKLWEKAGAHVKESLYFSMDYDLWLRFAEHGARLHVIGRPVAQYRQHAEQKTYVAERFQAELRQVRDTFLERTGHPARPSRGAPRRTHLKMVFLNDIAFLFGASVAHGRLAQAAVAAGHDVDFIAITPANIKGTKPAVSHAAILAQLEKAQPDVVVVGNLHGARLHPSVLGVIAERWPTWFVLHDLWMVTGRCAYPGGCEKYRGGCDATCPTSHEPPPLEPERIHDAWLSKRRLLASPQAPVLLGDSEWTTRFAREALKAGPSEAMFEGILPRLGAIRYGFPLDVFRPRDRRLCRELWNLPQDRFIILTSGTSVTDPRKGIEHLAEALRRLQLPDILVVSLGHFENDQRPPIPGMRALGFVNDPHRLALLYSAVDLFVGPSLEEAFGQVFVEAAACGTPSVGYPIGGIPEAIADGITGRLAATVHPDALAEAIEELYAQPKLRRQLGRWGRLHVENEFFFASAYHRMRSVLCQLGVWDQFGLPPRIGFSTAPPVLRPTIYVDPNVPTWRAVSGFTDWRDAPPGSTSPRSCGALGPVSRLEIHPDRTGRHSLLIACRNAHAGQRLRLVHNGTLVAETEVPVTDADQEHLLQFELDLGAGPNPIELHHWKWDLDQPDHPLAFLVHWIHHVPIAESNSGSSPPLIHLPLISSPSQKVA